MNNLNVILSYLDVVNMRTLDFEVLCGLNANTLSTAFIKRIDLNNQQLRLVINHLLSSDEFTKLGYSFTINDLSKDEKSNEMPGKISLREEDLNSIFLQM